MNKLSAVQIILALAAKEAARAGMKEISEEPFLVGLLKFAGMPDGQLTILTGMADSIEPLKIERDDLAEQVRSFGIAIPGKSVFIYRDLRLEMAVRKPGIQADANPRHRSLSLKSCFSRAGILAVKDGRKVPNASDLFSVILENPTQSIKKVLHRHHILTNGVTMEKPPEKCVTRPATDTGTMFTPGAREMMDKAKGIAVRDQKEILDIDAFFSSMASTPEALLILANAIADGVWSRIASFLPEPEDCPLCFDDLPISPKMQDLLKRSRDLAGPEGVPIQNQPWVIDIGHMMAATALDGELCRSRFQLDPIERESAMDLLSDYYSSGEKEESISELVSRLKHLQNALLSRIFGQDHAIFTFIEGLFHAEAAGAVKDDRPRPKGVFVFAGPPGVGKTYMVEIASRILDRPFKRFDMTAYSDRNTVNQLDGFAPTYSGASPGLLTSFVMENPKSLILFDEIEKAHLKVIQLFYQILDAGRLQDKFFKEDVSFEGCLIIFTTNAGKSLYDRPNASGISAANSAFHKKTIISALMNEKNPADGRPAFPAPICSRLSQGYPILFNNLGVNELERIADASMRKIERRLSFQYKKLFSHDEKVPFAMIFREGGQSDARQISADAEKFVKAELLRFCELYETDRLEEVFGAFDRVHFRMELPSRQAAPDIVPLFYPEGKPKILMVADPEIADRYREALVEFDWVTANSRDQVFAAMETEEPDFALLDIWMGGMDANRVTQASGEWGPEGMATIDQDADFTPFAAKRLKKGRELLLTIHTFFPQLPVYILSLMQEENEGGEPPDDSREDFFEKVSAPTLALSIDMAKMDQMGNPGDRNFRKSVDDALFLACTRAGGARGLVATTFGSMEGQDRGGPGNELADTLLRLSERIRREKNALKLSRERKALAFDTVSILDEKRRQLDIVLRNAGLTRVIDAADAGQMVDDVDRPETKFSDVIGAVAAKDALGYIVDWLKDPKRYAALGLRRPRGVLLAGPPGTGKTMLARALSGETDCAFIESSASGFVTKWVGSGPKTVNNLFERARRYAPTILFIDEIDSIGLKREGRGDGGGKAFEDTLNMLLTEMDGFGGGNSDPVIVLAATNLADKLDPALKRRFDRIITVDKPDRDARAKYLETELMDRKGSRISVDCIERIAIRSAGMTIADLRNVVQQAGVTSARKGTELSDEILEETFEQVRMGEERKIPPREVLERTAVHESGHAVIAFLGGNLPMQVTIVGRGGAGGYMEREIREYAGGYSKPEIEQLIREAMGGRAAEMVVYGEEDGCSTGASGDLQHATDLARKMATEFGMTETIGMACVDPRFLSDGPMAERVLHTIEKIIRAQLRQAVSILEENRDRLDHLTSVLLEKNRLSRDAIIEILS